MQEAQQERIEHVETRERKPKWVNVGEPPITGLLSVGEIQRKQECEDVKINDPQRGLFLVADGVGQAHGRFASTRAADTINRVLGSALDAELETIAQHTAHDVARKGELVERFVIAEMTRAILEADQTIETAAKLDPTIKKAATTASLAKLVAMPDGTQKLFYTNLGDSRVFVMRGSKLVRISEDDSYLTQAVRRGDLTNAEAYRIDQASGIDDVPENRRFEYQHRSVVLRSLGHLKDKDVDVESLVLQPGDRLMLASDGLTDQLKEKLIAQRLTESTNDRQAERVLQHEADDMAMQGTDPRAKPDDISVVVYTVGQKGPDRSSLHETKLHAVESQISSADVETWRRQIPLLEQKLATLRAQTNPTSPELATIENELARCEYWVARMDLEKIQEHLPPRYGRGDSIRVYRKDLEPPGFDRVVWTVEGFDEQKDTYTLKHPSGGKPIVMDRLSVELLQSKSLVRPKDQVNIDEHPYEVIGKDEGYVVLVRQRADGFERRNEEEKTVDAAIREMLREAARAKQTMINAKNKAK